MSEHDAKTKARPFRPLKGLKENDVACLETVRGQEQGRLYPLSVGKMTIGRGSSCDVALLDDGVSRHHAKLIVEDNGTVTLIDLESTNGTYLNRGQIERAKVRDGDDIQIGPDVTLRFGFRPRQVLERFVQASEPDEPTLTSRELEVARMAAQGRTNAEIGQELGISPRTVNSHLTKIYDRLDVHSRAALAVYLIDRKLMARGGR